MACMKGPPGVVRPTVSAAMGGGVADCRRVLLYS